jgi:hypothetical protein
MRVEPKDMEEGERQQQSKQEPLEVVLADIEGMIHRLVHDHKPTAASLRMAFSSSPHPKNTVQVANELMRPMSDRQAVYTEACRYLDGNDPFSLTDLLWDSYLADTGKPPVVGAFPLQDMQWRHSRVFMAFGTVDVPWCLVDVQLGAQPSSLSVRRRASVAVYSSRGIISSKVRKWIGVTLNLAKKRRDSPIRDVDIEVERIQEYYLPSADGVGLLAAAVVAAFISRHESLDPLQRDANLRSTMRLACAQGLQQVYAEACGDLRSTKTLADRVKSLLRLEVGQSSPTTSRATNTTKRGNQKIAPMALMTDAKTSRWTPVEEKNLIDMRRNGESWEDAAAALKRNVPSLKKRFYNLENNGSEGRKRIKVMETKDSDSPGDEAVESEKDDDQDVGINEQHQKTEARQVLPPLPLEIAGKVPCVNADRGCKEFFASYKNAQDHHTRRCKKKQIEGPYICKWPNCTRAFANEGGRANHYGMHNDDPSAPFVCRRDGCSRRWADEYLLTTHEGGCGRDKRPKGEKRTVRVLEFDLGPNNGQDASVIIVGRNSGGSTPTGWFAGKETLEEGIPIWAQPHLDDYRRLFDDQRRAKVVAGVRVRSAFVPSPPAAGFVLPTDSDGLKGDKRRAIKFTETVEGSVKRASDTPTIVSIGADGFACASSLIKDFLERNKPFRLVCRFHIIKTPNTTNSLSLTEALLTKKGDGWWRVYESKDILQRLRGASNFADKIAVDELVAWWNRLQVGKDGNSDYKLIPGRNNLQKPTSA